MSKARQIALSYDSPNGSRNRIINGDMRIDQRNSGAAVTPTDGQYTLDRWIGRLTQAAKYSIQQTGVTGSPGGNIYQLKITSLSAYAPVATDYFHLQYRVEGYNIADWYFGTASAAPNITLSFLVNSSVTGLFGGSILNNAGDRNYVFSYTVNTANTWETKTVTFPADVTGTWLNTNGAGLNLSFSLGHGANYLRAAGSWAAGAFFGVTGQQNIVATNAAVFQITGVQIETGAVATPFERIDYARQLIQCQRYYEIMPVTASTNHPNFFHRYLKVTKRITPSVTLISGSTSGGNYDSTSPSSFRMPSDILSTANTDCVFAISAEL